MQVGMWGRGKAWIGRVIFGSDELPSKDLASSCLASSYLP